MPYMDTFEDPEERDGCLYFFNSTLIDLDPFCLNHEFGCTSRKSKTKSNRFTYNHLGGDIGYLRKLCVQLQIIPSARLGPIDDYVLL